MMARIATRGWNWRHSTVRMPACGASCAFGQMRNSVYIKDVRLIPIVIAPIG
ncbi:hypothetical protein C7964_105163 [Loktanella sp. PT4BL]|nr:hypothetical protein C7964_105163 [Loktanella sp. PT4BL]